MSSKETTSTRQDTVCNAFRELEKCISPSDSREFGSTTLEDVKKAAVDIERQLAAKTSLCNMRRLLPLFRGLEAYHKPLEILCNGTPYLPWIWAPIKLILQISSDYLEAFEEIIKAYSRVAECLSRFDRFRLAFADNSLFQQALANFLSHLIVFHKEAYTFLRRGGKKNYSTMPSRYTNAELGWRRFFLTSWNRFRRRFEHMIEDLNRQADLVDREANSHGIVAVESMRQELQQWRTASLEKLAEQERERAHRQFQSVITWLKAETLASEQESIIDVILEEPRKYPSTGPWILKSGFLMDWLQEGKNHPILWLQGKAGSGKSVIATQVMNFLLMGKDSITVRHFCSYAHPESLQYDRILASFISQLLRNDDLVSYVYENYVVNKKFATARTLETLLTTLLHSVSPDPTKSCVVRVILDGLDECDQARQEELLSLIKNLVSGPETTTFKATTSITIKSLISCRDSASLTTSLKKYRTLSLYKEAHRVDSAINAYAHQRLQEYPEKLADWDFDSDGISELTGLISRKSNGMFLWARLVLDYLDNEIFFDKDEVYNAIDAIPSKLSDFYKRILAGIVENLEQPSIRRMTTSLAWIAFSRRPLRMCELRSALAFSSGRQDVGGVPPQRVIEPFKLLIEERSDSTLAFIHFSVAEFLKGEASGLFLVEKQAAFQQAMSCFACLLSGLLTFTSRTSNPDVSSTMRIVKGVFAFYPYARSYWMEHLLTAFDFESQIEGQNQTSDYNEMIRLGTDLAQRCLSTLSLDTTQTEEIPASKKRLTAVNKYPDLATLVRSEMRIMGNWDRSMLGSDNPDALDGPKSVLYEALTEYISQVNILLHANSVNGVNPASLQLFKQEIGRCTNFCRLSTCTWASTGFDTAQKRVAHEKTHGKILWCTWPGCEYPSPFRRTNGLENHMAKYHRPRVSPKPQSLSVIANKKEVEMAKQMLITHKINPASLTEKQFNTFAIQPPAVQAKMIATYQTPVATYQASVGN